LVRNLKGRTAVIPLSGGYDSRIIATLLKKLNYPDVITYTYGIRSSPEVAISKAVAEKFGFPWHFIEYRKELIDGFIDSSDFQAYYPFASNHVSSFFTQDYFAVKYLRDQRIVPEGAVFMPGHKSNAALDSSYVTGMNATNVVARLLQNRYTLRKRPEGFERKIESLLCCQSAVDNFLNWSSKELLSKFLVNSNRIYEYFGFEHLMPLWDKDLTDFILNLEDRWRTNYRLLWQVWFQYYFEPYEVAYKKKAYPFLIQKSVGVVKRAKRFLYADINNFKYIAKLFLNDEPLAVEWNSVQVNINTIQSSWYIRQLEKAG
jgi:asparagine synthase (glutamine-hydrolysing)